jgi:hypothetical protein
MERPLSSAGSDWFGANNMFEAKPNQLSSRGRRSIRMRQADRHLIFTQQEESWIDDIEPLIVGGRDSKRLKWTLPFQLLQFIM